MIISILILLLLFIVMLEYIIKPLYMHYFEFSDKYGLVYVRTKGKGLGYVLKINIIPVRYPLPILELPVTHTSLSVVPMHHQRYLTQDEMHCLSFSLTLSDWKEDFSIISPSKNADLILIEYSKEEHATSYSHMSINEYNYIARVNKEIQLNTKYMIAVAQTEYIAPKYYSLIAHTFEACDRIRIFLSTQLQKRIAHVRRYV